MDEILYAYVFNNEATVLEKNLAIALALDMTASLSLTAFATNLDLEDLYTGENAATGSNDELIGINFLDGMTFNTGDNVYMMITGRSYGTRYAPITAG